MGRKQDRKAAKREANAVAGIASMQGFGIVYSCGEAGGLRYLERGSESGPVEKQSDGVGCGSD